MSTSNQVAVRVGGAAMATAASNAASNGAASAAPVAARTGPAAGAASRTAIIFQWPSPPFFRAPAEPPVGRGRECVLEFIDGQGLHGELVSIEADGSFVNVRVPHEGLHQIALEWVRSIRLKGPLAFVPDHAVLSGVGADTPRVTEAKSFAVTFEDGKCMAGKTRGFFNGSHGLFLFLVENDPRLSVSCFIPKRQIKDVQIGPLLGETLQDKGFVDRSTLNTVLDRQARQRNERLGEYLIEQQIVSPEELKQALATQRLRPHVRLGDLLLESKLITPEDLSKALAIQAGNRQRRLGDILVSMGLVSVRRIQLALSDKLGIPSVNAREFEIDPAVLELVSGALAIQHQVLPLLRTGDRLIVAVENPLSVDFEQELRFTTRLAIVPVIGDPEDIRARLAKEYQPIDGRAGAPARPEALHRRNSSRVKVEELANQLAKETPKHKLTAPLRDTDAGVTDNTLVRLVNKIIVDAHSQGASDIHVETDPERNARVRFRKDGDLEDYLELPPAYRSAVVSRLKIMAGLDISERRRGQDGKINFGRFGPAAIELRIAIIPTANDNEDVVMRLMGGVEPKPLDQLSFTSRDLEALKGIVTRSYGLLLVCGPTGSGKTTTLHSLLHHINQPDLKIWTAEDPIEITQPGLRQVQINPKIDWTFAAAMRSFLRADPDVIMVGEMRDGETATIGIEASLTGHLVLSTLHTNSAAESVTRLLNLGMDPFNFADALLGVLSQRLARRLCPNCKRPHVATEPELTNLANEYCAATTLDPKAVLSQWRAEFGHHGQIKLHKAGGCTKCSQGYKGRMGVYELLVASPEVKDLVRTKGTVPQLVAAGRAGGMLTLKQDALRKVLSGDLDLTCARAVSS